MRFREKPIEIEAQQWLPADPRAAGSVIAWLQMSGAAFRCADGTGSRTSLAVHTLKGAMTVSPGDWVIRGVQGEFYPCKPDIFSATYEPVD
jgi:hypothetical protein